jgi:hypothetical protein
MSFFMPPLSRLIGSLIKSKLIKSHNSRHYPGLGAPIGTFIPLLLPVGTMGRLAARFRPSPSLSDAFRIKSAFRIISFIY